MRKTRPHLHSYENLLDVGTGVWWLLERLAWKATNEAKVASFVYTRDLVCDSFVCKECRTHFKQFIETNDINNYWAPPRGNFNPRGCFEWMVEAHNNANFLTGKEHFPLQKAIEYQQKLDNGEGCESCTLKFHEEEEKEERPKEKILLTKVRRSPKRVRGRRVNF